MSYEVRELINIYRTQYTICHAPLLDADGEVKKHHFIISKPFKINTDRSYYRNGQSHTRPAIPKSDQSNLDKWATHLLVTDFTEPDFEWQLRIITGFEWTIWEMTSKWVDRDTQLPFLKDYPQIYKFLLAVPPEIERPDNVYINGVLKEFKDAGGERYLYPVDHTSGKRKVKKKK